MQLVLASRNKKKIAETSRKLKQLHKENEALNRDVAKCGTVISDCQIKIDEISEALSASSEQEGLASKLKKGLVKAEAAKEQAEKDLRTPILPR